MSVEDYPQYSITFGFQSTLGILVDVGFSGSILALVGERINDKDVLGLIFVLLTGLKICLSPVNKDVSKSTKTAQ